jgi:hypothetical protein
MRTRNGRDLTRENELTQNYLRPRVIAAICASLWFSSSAMGQIIPSTAANYVVLCSDPNEKIQQFCREYTWSVIHTVKDIQDLQRQLLPMRDILKPGSKADIVCMRDKYDTEEKFMEPFIRFARSNPSWSARQIILMTLLAEYPC